MTTSKMLATTKNKIDAHKRIYRDYLHFINLPHIYNKGEVINDVFTLIRIKDGSTICRFNINTFEAC